MANASQVKKFTGKLLGSLLAFSMFGQSLAPIQLLADDDFEEVTETEKSDNSLNNENDSWVIGEPETDTVIEDSLMQDRNQEGDDSPNLAILDEKAQKSTDTAASINDINDPVNPAFTLQHYVYFGAVVREKYDKNAINGKTALPIINTNPKVEGETVKSGADGLNPYKYLMNKSTGQQYIGGYWNENGGNAESPSTGGLPTNQIHWDFQWMIKLKGDGTLNTQLELVPMFADEHANFLSKPAIQNMSLIDEENENYKLSEIWIQQPDDPNGAFPDPEHPDLEKFYKISLKDRGPESIRFTNNERAVGQGGARFPLVKIDKNNQPIVQDNGELKITTMIKEIGSTDNPIYLILIKPGTVVRLAYGTKDGSQRKDANFFDYDITDGKIYKNEEDAKNGVNGALTNLQGTGDYQNVIGVTNRYTIENPYGSFGINSSKNVEESNYPWLGFGNSNTGTGLGFFTWNNGGKDNQINKANDATAVNNPRNPLGLTFGLSTGINRDGSLKFASGIAVPKLFSTNDAYIATDVNKDRNGHKNGQYLKSNSVDGKSMFKKRENSDEQGSDEYYSLMFDQAGGTYTLNQVYRHYGDTSQDGVPVVNGLNSFKKTISKVVTNGTGTDELGENGSEKLGFWPMDAASTWGAEGHDLKFGAGSTPGEYKVSDKNKYYGLTSSDQITTPGKLKSDGEKLERGLKNFPIGDDAYDHNSYFGMTFHEDFILEPGYCAPLRYFFYGDDDMFVYLTDITNAYEYDSEKREDVPKQNYDSIVSAALDDSNMTKKISGVGGVHSSAGMYTDLWNFLKPLSTEESASRNEGKAKSNHYRLSVYYDERGESGSTCYMRYTLPLKPVKTAERDYEGNLKIEKNVLSGNSENQSDSYNFKVKLFNFGSTGDDYSLVNKYNYEIYQKGEEGFPDSLIQNGQMQSYNDSLDQPAANTPESDENQNNQVINGSFDLEDNQYVLIKRLINGTRYQVTETNAGKMTTYAVGTIDEGIQSATSPIGSESVSGSVDAEAGDVENADKNYVVFYNADNPGRLSIQKKLNEEITDQNRGQVFSFRVKLTDQNGSKLPGKVGYTVSKTDSGTS